MWNQKTARAYITTSSTEDIFALPTDISELQTADLAVVPREASKDNLHKNDKRGNL